ncbi:MAG: tetratricopeptide repeat protein, partial [Planctomycetes bacterium]|nr:tetratricopeptide repeat protein [Planctomycetota bacterium]
MDHRYGKLERMFFSTRIFRKRIQRFCTVKVLPVWFVVCLMGSLAIVDAAELEDSTKALRTGDHATCIRITDEAIQKRLFGEDWYLLKSEAELQTGQYQKAYETLEAGLARYSWSIRMRLIGVEAARMTGNPTQGEKWIGEIAEEAAKAPWRYSDADNLVALGRTAILLKADARRVLEAFFDRALKQHPLHREAILASGELALEKKDFQLAAETFQAANQKYPDDADVQFGIVRALDRSAPPLAAHALTLTLRNNPRHTGALLYQAENALDAERYSESIELLDKVLAINPQHPSAWAYRSVIAALKTDLEGANQSRSKGLEQWKENPLVDFLIGKKLSQKYRFAEGANHQRQALAMSENYQPAQVQLAQDLLRLGKEDEGWELGKKAYSTDEYDVHLYNLMQLRDQIARFQTIEREGFVIRMESKEREIYGEDVVRLLIQAKSQLCEKYGIELKDTITVEIFAEPSDFAVRTFGMPGVSGYLGVCFGKVITANSPASQREHPSNWQSVLWHEFCHVVTLEATHNRMPRWLSEGISVYEERLANPRWGQRMNVATRTRIASGLLIPIGELSGAFLKPETPADLNFAYFQSSLVVEHLIERYGIDALKRVLKHLSDGLPIDVAIERELAVLEQLDEEF